MLFNVDFDTGDRIVGYVVPDGYSKVPSIRVRAEGRELSTISANETREALVHAGRHETGLCGFAIDAAMVPNLERLSDLELLDEETGTLIYRRPVAQVVKRKVLRIETHLYPLYKLDQAVGARFHYFSKGIEKLGRETIVQMLLLNKIESVYLSGKILYRSYAYFIESGFDTIAVVHDPYEELAERLLVLSKVRTMKTPLLDMRENAMLDRAVAYAEQLPFRDAKALSKAVRQMPDDVVAQLANPLVRQLTTNTPDEMPGGGAVASALDVLATCRVVGCRRQSSSFVDTFAEFLGLEPHVLPQMPNLKAVTEVARILRETGDAEAFLEKDLEVYHVVEGATKNASARLVSEDTRDGGVP